MKQVLVLLVWCALVVGIGAAVFSPNIGLLTQGHGTMVGAGLLGLAMIVEGRRRMQLAEAG